MTQTRILIAEDDPHIRTGLVDMLESEGFATVPAEDGEAALALLENEKIHLALLDVMMPRKSGYDVCRSIRKTDPRLPVLMLTAKGEEIDKVIGLQLGADDYLTKPFGVAELLARINALLRRADLSTNSIGQGSQTFEFALATIEPGQFKGATETKQFQLSPRELKLIQIFAAHPNQVLQRDFLLEQVWGLTYTGTTRTLDQHIVQLRKKIEPHPKQPQFLHTVHGIGYRYEPKPKETMI